MSSYREVGVIPPVPRVLSSQRPCPIQCSSDGKRVIYGTDTGIVSRCLPDQYDSKTKVVETFVGNQTPIEVAALSPDNATVAGGDNNGTIYLWMRSREGTKLLTYQLGMPNVRITDLSFSDDSKRLAVSGVDKYSRKLGAVIVVDAGNAIGEIEGHTLGINSISYRQKKPYMIATAGADGLVCFHSGPPFKLVNTSYGHEGQVYCIRFAPDVDQVISCGQDGKLRVWDSSNGELDHVIELSDGALYSLAWCTDSSRVAVVGADRKLRLVHVLSSNILDEIIVGGEATDTPVGVCWSSTNWVCVVCTSGRIWGYKTEQQKKFIIDQQFLWQGTNGGASAVGINPLSGRIAIGDSMGTLLFLWAKDSEPRAFNCLKLPSPSTIRSALVGKELGAAVTMDGTIRVFRLPKERSVDQKFALPQGVSEDTTKPLKPPSSRLPYVRSISHYTDGQTALDSTGKGTLGLTNEVAWISSHQFKDAPVKALSIDNEAAVVVACTGGMLYAYPFSAALTRFYLLWSLKIHGTITAASATVDGSLVAIGIVANGNYPLERFGDGRTSLGSSPYLIEMYEVDSYDTTEGFRFICVYELHKSEITCLALNPPGTHLASADASGNIHVVEVETGIVVIREEWKQQMMNITSLDWSPIGLKLASGSVGKEVFIWDVEAPSQIIKIHNAHQGEVTCVQAGFPDNLVDSYWRSKMEQISSASTDILPDRKKPVILIVIGMAGSGKTTMMKALHAHFSQPSVIAPPPVKPLPPQPSRRYSENDEIVTDIIINEMESESMNDTENDESKKSEEIGETSGITVGSSEECVDLSVNTSSIPSVTRPKLRSYIINLDPAVKTTPYPVNIDIRDTINYKKVMKEYKLGPNGAIMTSLNLFATKFDQVLQLLEKRSNQLDVVLVDTPGQIEAFNWSASGSIILDSLAVSFPTIVIYVVDTARCKSPITFMSNMTYACSVLYKSKLPFIMAFNKIDIRSAEECFKWMQSYDAYADDIVKEDSYMASLSRSCALAMNEFYEGIRSVGVSAGSQLGFVQLESCINESRDEYFSQYLPWLNEQRAAVRKRREKLLQESAKKFTADREADEDRNTDLEELRQLEELRAKIKKTDIPSS